MQRGEGDGYGQVHYQLASVASLLLACAPAAPSAPAPPPPVPEAVAKPRDAVTPVQRGAIFAHAASGTLPHYGEPADVTGTSEFIWIDQALLPAKRKG